MGTSSLVMKTSAPLYNLTGSTHAVWAQTLSSVSFLLKYWILSTFTFPWETCGLWIISRWEVFKVQRNTYLHRMQFVANHLWQLQILVVSVTQSCTSCNITCYTFTKSLRVCNYQWRSGRTNYKWWSKC